MAISAMLKKVLVNATGSRALKGIIEPVSTPGSEYGMENSPEWNYYKDQVADYRAGRSAYRSQRTTEGSPTFALSDEEYKEASDKHYSGLLNQINANRPEGIGEFGLSTRMGRIDPSLINFNPDKTKGFTFSREGRMEQIDDDRISDYPDVEKETAANRASVAADELTGKFNPGAVALADQAFKGQGGLKGFFGQAIEKSRVFKRV